MKIKLFKISVILSFFLAVLSSCSNEDFIDNLREELYNEETKKLTQAQKDLLRGLKIFRVDEECIIVIMLMTQKAFQTEMMIDYIISHEKATQEELLSKAMEISKLKGKSH